jgi:hypothetical protein
MKHLFASVASFVRLPLVGMAFLGFFERVSAQVPADPEPVRNAIVFTMHLYGSGSDPAPTVNSAISEASQGWTYYRELDGWFEVDVRRRREGSGAAARELVEFSRKRHHRQEITGGVSDWTNNFERWIGEGFDTGVHADYRARETTDWRGEIDPLPSPYGVVLDATNKRWVEMLDPQLLIGDYQPKADFHAEADFKPNSPGGFGEPWTYSTEDPSLKLAGEHKQIEVRFNPGHRGLRVTVPEAERRNVPAKFHGTIATGRVEYKVPRPKDASGEWTEMLYVVDWEARTELPDVELEVRSPEYGKWRPRATEESATAGPGRAYGPGLNFSAKLRRVDGNKKAPLPKIEAMEWRLVNTSREPGIAMNFPYQSDDKRPDMEIVASDLTAPEDDTAQAVVFRSPSEAVTAATVYPFDWGGWTTLRVTAKLDDGRTIVGRLKGAPGVTGSLENIPVPASPPGSHIAWSWLREKCPGWHSDAADEDRFPVGRAGVDGDGFSVYEEYRGYYLYKPRTHYSTEPAKKDLFVLNNAGFQAGAGIGQFFKVSKLGRWLLMPGDLPRADQNERTVNCNIGAGATNGPQTAVYITTTKKLDRLNDLIAPNSRPATVPAIFVPADNSQLGELSSGLHADVFLNQSDALYTVLDHMVMQAMFQAVGVDRPGPSGEVVRRVFVPAAASSDGKPHFLLLGAKVVMERESDGFDFAVAEQKWWDPPLNGAGRSTVRYVLIGTPGSAHSGPENCVMRDWFADFYLSRETRDGLPLYRTRPSEKPGTQLGTTRKGTGINLGTRFPEPAYGDSKVANPANRQLVVKDSAP